MALDIDCALPLTLRQDTSAAAPLWSSVCFGDIQGVLSCLNVSLPGVVNATLAWQSRLETGYWITSAITDGDGLLVGTVRPVGRVSVVVPVSQK